MIYIGVDVWEDSGNVVVVILLLLLLLWDIKRIAEQKRIKLMLPATEILCFPQGF